MKDYEEEEEKDLYNNKEKIDDDNPKAGEDIESQSVELVWIV